MKRTVLDRYGKASDGTILVDVAAAQVEDLYDDYDRSAPYVRRDLNQDLVDYLIECAKEVGKAPFLVSFTLAQFPDRQKQTRVCHSVNAYFRYLADIERQKIVQMFRRSAILFGVGLTLLFLSVSAHQALRDDNSVVASVFAEGLTIAAWVSLWESLAIFILEWQPHRRSIRLYQRMAGARLLFRLRDMPQGLENERL